MTPAEEDSFGGSHGLKQDPGSHGRNNENQDRLGRGGKHHGSSDTDLEPCKAVPFSRGRDLHESPARGASLHGERDLHRRHNEGDESRQSRRNVDDVSGDHKQMKWDVDDASGHDSQRMWGADGVSGDHRLKRRDADHHSWRRRGIDDVSGDHRQRSPDVNDAMVDHRLRKQDVDSLSRDHRQKRQDVNDALGDHRQKKRDVHDVLGEYTRKRGDADDVAGDHNRSERDVDDVAGDHSRRRRDADNALSNKSGRRQEVEDGPDSHSWRRRDIDDVPGNRSQRLRDADDVLDKHSQRRRDIDDVSGARSKRRQDVDDAVVGDASRRRRDIDDAVDNHSRRRRDVNDALDDHRHHEQQRSPHRRRNLHDRRGGNEERDARARLDDGQRGGRTMNNNGSSGRQRDMEEDRFSAQCRNSERNKDELPDLFSVHRAKVQSVRPFGLFVRLEGFYRQGLVHLSQLSDHEVTEREDSDEKKVQAIAAVAGEGDQVWVKVISLRDDGGSVKIGCSLKLVSQSTGKDLDPSNVKLDQQQPKEKRQEPKKVTLDAIYNVVCSRCGGHGHLKTECFGMANKSYELLPEEDDDLTQQLPQPSQAQMGLGEVIIKPGFGRGRSMVLPAWMTHGSGANALQQIGSEPEKQKKRRRTSELPDKVTTVEEAKALIAQVKKAKKDKHHRKDHKKHKKDKKSKKPSKKESSSRKDRG